MATAPLNSSGGLQSTDEFSNDDDTSKVNEDTPAEKTVIVVRKGLRLDDEQRAFLQQKLPTEFYCDVCFVHCSSEHTKLQHLQGKPHKKKLTMHKTGLFTMADGGSKPATAVAPLNVIDLPNTPSQFAATLSNIKIELVGLDHITEYMIQGYPDITPYLFCDLCKRTLNLQSGYAHVSGIKHRLNYLNRYHRDLFVQVSSRPEGKKTRSNLTSEVATIIHRIWDNSQPRKQIQVKVDLNPCPDLIKIAGKQFSKRKPEENDQESPPQKRAKVALVRCHSKTFNYNTRPLDSQYDDRTTLNYNTRYQQDSTTTYINNWNSDPNTHYYSNETWDTDDMRYDTPSYHQDQSQPPAVKPPSKLSYILQTLQVYKIASVEEERTAATISERITQMLTEFRNPYPQYKQDDSQTYSNSQSYTRPPPSASGYDRPTPNSWYDQSRTASWGGVYPQKAPSPIPPPPPPPINMNPPRYTKPIPSFPPSSRPSDRSYPPPSIYDYDYQTDPSDYAKPSWKPVWDRPPQY